MKRFLTVLLTLTMLLTTTCAPALAAGYWETLHAIVNGLSQSSGPATRVSISDQLSMALPKGWVQTEDAEGRLQFRFSALDGFVTLTISAEGEDVPHDLLQALEAARSDFITVMLSINSTVWEVFEIDAGICFVLLNEGKPEVFFDFDFGVDYPELGSKLIDAISSLMGSVWPF